MSKYLKLIWFTEDHWTKIHAAVGIKAEKTLCGITRSTRAILPSEKFEPGMCAPDPRCRKCLAVLIKRYGAEDIMEVKVE